MPWLTADETATRYRITVKGLLKQRAEGRLPGSLGKRVGKRVLWASEDLDRHDHPEETPVAYTHESDSFGALHALILEVRGTNKRLDSLLAELVSQRPVYYELSTEELEDE